MIKEVKKRFNKVDLVTLVEDKNEYTLDLLFKNEIYSILFDFNPENLLKEITDLYENMKKIKQQKNKQRYLINFYENKNIFFIDITGTIEKEKISQLKLMFMHHLGNKLEKIKGVVYIFNNTDENSMIFQNIWLLFRFWKSLKISYEKIYYLTSSENITNNIQKYLGDFNIKKCSNLLEIVRYLFPELKNKNDMELFEFASTLLQTNSKINPNQ